LDIIKPFQWYSKEEIERQAETLLQQVQKKRTRPLKPVNLAETVADFLDLGIVWDNIEPDTEGQIAAIILPTQKEIVINSNIPGLKGGFGQSTIAHEIGHWILHIDKNAVGQFRDYLEQGIRIPVQPFLCRSANSSNNLEWQAQYFASCLLMPISKLEKAAKGRNLTNWKHLYAMANEFGVTSSNLLNRLKSLNWIVCQPNCKQIYLGKNAPSKEKMGI
jgi:Zn-dependent peptidase ImmA (M78 family)